MRILLIGGLKNSKAIYHYSDIKTMQLALGFASLGHSVYMPEDSDHHDNPVIKKMSLDYNPHIYHLIIFTRENFVKYFWDKYPVVKDLCTRNIEKTDGFPIVCARYGNYLWYKDLYETIEEFYGSFDFHFPQEYSFCKRFISDLATANLGDKGRIWPSNMAVPKQIVFSLKPPFAKDKKILLYIGRLRQFPPRYDFIMEFMRELGSEYRLLIIPGSFNKIEEEESTKYNPVNEQDGKQWLVDKFSSSGNIKVLDPVPWGPHWDYLYHADYGIDFAPSVKGSSGGNAKLIEYMRAGLPTITEPSVTNSGLVPFCKGGIVAWSSNNLKDYLGAFTVLRHTDWDRDKIARTMADTHNWEVRASEIISNIGNTEDRNLSFY